MPNLYAKLQPLLEAYKRELTTFPGSKYDDQVDSTTQALDHLKTYRSLLVWEKQRRLINLDVIG